KSLRYAWRTVPIRYLLLLLSVISFLGLSYITLIPVFVKTVLGGEAHTYGLLMGSAGAGALAGALYLASRKNVRGLISIAGTSSAAMSLCLISFYFIRSTVVSCCVLAGIGFSLVLMMGACNTVIQTIVEESMRGRVMALYTMAFMGLNPFGCLLMGWLSDKIGPQHSIMIGGVCCAAVSLYFISRRKEIRAHIRPVYIRLGIIPAVVE
ncbi:MAG: MFS transporter, partial [Spirochaetota bacterium]